MKRILLAIALVLMVLPSQAASPKRTARQLGLSYSLASSPSDFTRKDCLYEIRGEIDLGGGETAIPSGCVLYFKGGAFSGGTLKGDGTRVISSAKEIFRPGTTVYRGYLRSGSYNYVSRNKGGVILGGTWAGEDCPAAWTGLKRAWKGSCASTAINNFIVLHRDGAAVSVPKGSYDVYGKIRCGNHSVDFNGGTLRSVDFNAVEDTSLPLPQGAVPAALRSIYGLVEMTGDGCILSRLAIDGGADRRNETPDRGSQCLLSLGSNRGGAVRDVTLQNAVACGICTYKISDMLFSGLRIRNVGEHGIYTHACKGELRFKDCEFFNCGSSQALFKDRGQSACINVAGSRDSGIKGMAGLSFTLEDCVFATDGSCQVATMYADLPKAGFTRCRWQGVNGYTVNTALAEGIGRLVEYTFTECDNPCWSINSANTVRRLVRCTNVRNPFSDAVLLEDCQVTACYGTVRNLYTGRFASETGNPVVCRRCTFSKDGTDISIGNTIANPRPMVFEDCNWRFEKTSSDKSRGTAYITLQGKNGRAEFRGCNFDMDIYRLISVQDGKVEIDGGRKSGRYELVDNK